MTGRLLLICAVLTGCSAAPRSTSYFHAHLDEAAKVMVDCEAGSHRGAECDNANTAIDIAHRDAAADARMALYRKNF